MKRLLLVRHGQTEWNKIQRIQGQLDAPMDATGHAQAAAVRPMIAAYEPDVLWSSNLSRAHATAERISEECGIPVVIDTRLRELNFGERQGLTHTDYAAIAPAEYAAVFRDGDHSAIRGGEKPVDVTERITNAIREMLDLTPEGGCAVGVSHGLAIKYAIAGLLGWPEDLVRTLRGLYNCSWSELRFDSAGRAVLVAYNRITPIS